MPVDGFGGRSRRGEKQAAAKHQRRQGELGEFHVLSTGGIGIGWLGRNQTTTDADCRPVPTPVPGGRHSYSPQPPDRSDTIQELSDVITRFALRDATRERLDWQQLHGSIVGNQRWPPGDQPPGGRRRFDPSQ